MGYRLHWPYAEEKTSHTLEQNLLLLYIWGFTLHGVGVALGLREMEGNEKALSSAMRTGIHLLTKLVCLFVFLGHIMLRYPKSQCPSPFVGTLTKPSMSKGASR